MRQYYWHVVVEGGAGMAHRLGIAGETFATLISAILAGIACCGPVVIQWLGLLVWAIGGRTLLLGLVRYEILILATITAAAFVGRRVALDRPTRWANTLLAGVAAIFVALRMTWEMRRGAVMAIDPVLTLFSYRQTVLLVVAGIVFAVRITFLIATLWHRLRRTRMCRVQGSWNYRLEATWT
jgi:hypothetical protein